MRSTTICRSPRRTPWPTATAGPPQRSEATLLAAEERLWMQRAGAVATDLSPAQDASRWRAQRRWERPLPEGRGFWSVRGPPPYGLRPMGEDKIRPYQIWTRSAGARYSLSPGRTP